MADCEGVSTARYLPPAPAPISPAEAIATLDRILDAIEEYVYTGEFLDGDRYRVVFAGPCRERFLGMSVEDGRIAIWADYVHPDDVVVFEDAHVAAHATGLLDVEYRLVGADGVVRWVRDRGRLRNDDGRRLLDASILDVTAVRAAQEEARAAHALAHRLARTDPLTGVANRRSLPELVAALGASPLGVLSLDIDRFKLVNDFYGHAVGDAVLVALADRLRGVLGADDRIVRMGGEEFLLLLPGVADDRALLERADHLRRSVEGAPVAVDGLSLAITASIGATLAGAEREFDAVLAAADRFLYAAKRAGRNRVRVGGADDAEEEEDGEPESISVRLASAMAAAATAADGIPEGHLAAVSQLAARVARHLGAPAPVVLRCRLGGLLHDLGKLQLPAAVLAKRAAPDSQEWALIRRHPEWGERLVAAVPEFAPVASIVRHHHERYDGGGYPDGLAGDAISLEARIVAAADSWHTITSDRPYRKAAPAAEARSELARAAGRQLDPDVVAALLAVVSSSAVPGPQKPGELSVD